MKKILQFLFGIIFPLISSVLAIFLTMTLYTLPVVMNIMYKLDMMNGVNELFILAIQAGASFGLSRYVFLWILMNKIYKDGKINF